MNLQTMKHRVHRLEDANRPDQRVFFVTASMESPGIIPDDYEPGRDILFTTSYMDRDPSLQPEFYWRGERHESTEPNKHAR